jgi:dienelactone hydrolase
VTPAGKPVPATAFFSLMKRSWAGIGWLAVCGLGGAFAADEASLPGTAALSAAEDRGADMVAGISRFADRLLERAPEGRSAVWEAAGGPEEMRRRLRTFIGAVDERTRPVVMEKVTPVGADPVVAETAEVVIERVRWPVVADVWAEGLLLTPRDTPPVARLIFIPDPAQTPEQLLGVQEGSKGRDVFLKSGCQILVPALLDRGREFSRSESLGKGAAVTHREWIYRQSFILGRHPLGFEVMSVEAAVDWMKEQGPDDAVCVLGFGEGGWVALHAAALDERVDGTLVGGCFGPREGVWSEPIERNVWRRVSDFGDAGVAALVAPRRLVIENAHFPVAPPPAENQGGRVTAAPGQFRAFGLKEVEAEAAAARQLAGVEGDWLRVFPKGDSAAMVPALLPEEAVRRLAERRRTTRAAEGQGAEAPRQADHREHAAARQQRLVRQWSAHCQRLVAASERARQDGFWRRAQGAPRAVEPGFEDRVRVERESFWENVIGRLPDPDAEPRPASRLVRETERAVLHELRVEVWEDVFAWAWVALPKDLKPGERRPVVVVQHGLEGLPEHCFETEPSTRAFAAYQAFGLRLAEEEGYVVVAPHNLYRGGDEFRVLQRKLNPLGLSLFSVIIGQHQALLSWVKSQAFAEPSRIGFYGLSYGGKTAMRVPTVLEDYTLSICSGDFNEWVRKNMSTEMPMSYIFTHEYEIWEWDLAHTLNYAEMAVLMAPRPFMVERGHDDGVGLDEWVDYEFAKVRRFYNKAGLGDKAVIEHFNGPHAIFGVGTFQFLNRFLRN